MRRGIVASMLVLMVLCGGAIGNAHADRQAAVEQAKKAAEAWLKLIDEGKYQESWSEAATFFKDRITAEGWAQMVGAVRKPLGALVSRDFKLAHYSTSLPGAPAGEYDRNPVRHFICEPEVRGRNHHPNARQRRPVARLGILHQAELDPQ